MGKRARKLAPRAYPKVVPSQQNMGDHPYFASSYPYMGDLGQSTHITHIYRHVSQKLGREETARPTARYPKSPAPLLPRRRHGRYPGAPPSPRHGRARPSPRSSPSHRRRGGQAASRTSPWAGSPAAGRRRRAGHELGHLRSPSIVRGREEQGSAQTGAMLRPPPPPPIVDLLATPTSTNAGALTLFDGMAASLDDDAYLNYASHEIPTQEFSHVDPSQEYAQENEGFVGEGDEDVEGEGIVGEGDGEGFVEPTPRRAVRGANFTQKEDEALCNAWRLIGIDPITGNEQLNNSYWERIHEHFKLHSKRPRTTISLQHRWSTINADCQKWSGCLAQVDRLNPSGTNSDDKQNIAQNFFMGKPKKRKNGTLKEGKAFTLFHCWTILENDEKWRNRPSFEIPNKRKTHTSVGEGMVLDTDDEGSSSPTPLSSVNRKRPEGRKKAKDMRAKGVENMYKESLDNMMAVRKELAHERSELKAKEIEERKLAEERKVAAEERRAAAEERRAAAEEKLALIEERKLANEEMLKQMENEQRIMFMDSSKLDEKGRAYLEMCKDQILLSKGFTMRGNGGGSGGGGANGGGGDNGGGGANGDGGGL